MRHLIAVLLLCCACASAPLTPYRACVMSRHQGRELFVTGTVVRQETVEGRTRYWFVEDNKPETRELRQDERVNRMCRAISPSQGFTGAEYGGGGHAPRPEEP